VTADEGAIKVVVSSRDGAPVPVVAGAVRLEKAATAAGWAARQTFALAELPQTHTAAGELRHAARRLASVAVRFVRGQVAGWAIWHSVDDGPWRFVGARIGFAALGLRALTAALA
jgi:hypothetical protein